MAAVDICVCVIGPLAILRDTAFLLKLYSRNFVIAPSEETFDSGLICSCEGGVFADTVGVGKVETEGKIEILVDDTHGMADTVACGDAV